MTSSSLVARVFDAAASTYEATGTAYFDPMGQRLVDLAGVQPGYRVLDVGTGRGAVLRPAARAVGAGGFVLGLDASMGMAVLTTADLAGHDRGPGAPAAVVVADAVAPPIAPASVDAVLAGMLAQFLPDPAAALRAWAAVAVPGGRLALSWWAGEDDRYAALGDAVARHLPDASLDAGPSAARAFSGDVKTTEDVIEAAGWEEVVTVVEAQQVRFADIGAWWRWSWSHGQRRRWDAVADLDRLREDVDAELGTLSDSDGSLLYQPRAAFTTARARR